MASTYMNNYRQQCRADMDSKISSEEYGCRKTVNSLSSRYQSRKKWSDYLKPTGCASAVVGFFLLCALGPFFSIFGLLLWPILNFIIVPTKNQKIDSNNDEISRQISEREAACKERCKAFEIECERRIAEEEKRYKSEASKARKIYGGSTVIDPIINFVADDFELRIRATNRAAHVSYIVAECFFDVEETQLCIFDTLPHSGQNYASKKYDFFINRFYNLPEFYDRIGFAQALSKRVEFEILRRFPTDPVAPSRAFKPKVEIDYDDTLMHLTYKVQNPNYRAAVHMRTGIGS